ncbi:MAG: hypothetical protein NXI04_05470 [Planctomycetaceae bacterium]|nr:hypothetical protein [Planctomycetaceae bacterium]
MRLGIAGVGKVGKWLPVTAAASGLPAGEQVELQGAFADPRGDRCIQTMGTATVSADGTVEFAGCFCVGRLEGSARIAIVGDGVELCTTYVRHGETDDLRDDSDIQKTLQLFRLNVPLLLTFGEVAGIPELLRNAEQYADDTVILKGVQLDTLAQLPTEARALESIDCLLLVTDFDAGAERTAAVRGWVENGGDLYFSVGGNVEAFLASDAGQWLNEFFQLQPEAVSIRELSSLQSFVPGASRLETGRRTVPIAISRSDQNQNDVDFLSGPIVARQGVGTGTATFIAVDVNARPLDRWLSLPQFYEVLLLGEKLSRTSGGTKRSSRISQSGVSELATQLMAALDATPAEGVWSTWSIMAMMLTWLALIGPVDYFLVSRVLNRPHMTWFTFPALIAIGVGTIYAATSGTVDDTLNQLHVVDVFNQGSGSSCHSRSWMSFSSTQTARRNFQATPALSDAIDAQARLIWSGRPEDVYGGMYRTGGIGLGRQDYVFSENQKDTLQNLPVLTKGSRQMLAEWQGQTSDVMITSQLEAAGFGLLSGSFEHHLPGPVSEYTIFHGNRVYEMQGSEPLEPGVAWNARQTGVRASDLKAYLNGAVLIRSDNPIRKSGTQTATPYNPQSRDTQYILTMATFFDIAGGGKYVGLSQEYLRHMELSDTIRLNHAVLIGKMDLPATTLGVDGEAVTADQSSTLVRLLIPVTRRPSGAVQRTDDEIKNAARRAQENDE